MAVFDPAQITTLALSPGSVGSWLGSAAPGVRSTPDRAAFRQLLRASGPAVVVVWVPPATAEEIGDVAAARRVRRDLRAILIDKPAASGERVTALRSGFDEALDSRVDHAELASRIDLLGEEIRAAARGAPPPAGRKRLARSRASAARGRRSAGTPSPARVRTARCAVSRDLGQTFSREELLNAVGAGPTQRPALSRRPRHVVAREARASR